MKTKLEPKTHHTKKKINRQELPFSKKLLFFMKAPITLFNFLVSLSLKIRILKTQYVNLSVQEVMYLSLNRSMHNQGHFEESFFFQTNDNERCECTASVETVANAYNFLCYSAMNSLKKLLFAHDLFSVFFYACSRCYYKSVFLFSQKN